MKGGRSQSKTSRQENGEHWGARGTAGVSFAAALSFSNVEVRLGSNLVLDKLNLSVEPGEILCLLGESGSGKSTVLRTAAGLQPIDSGEVRINDVLVSAPGLSIPPGRRGIGLMFQDFALFPHMTLLQNAMFGLDRLNRPEARRQALAALRRVGLEARAEDYPHMLSGGQQQRLALARSIAPRPGIILLDEPFSSLDARMRESVRAETLAILRETGATAIIVTHDPVEATLLGDRVGLLRDGKLVQADKASVVYDRPADLATARFLTQLSEIEAMVCDGILQTPFGPVPARGRMEGQKAVVAIRPVGDLDMQVGGSGTPGRIVSKRESLGLDIFEIKVEGLAAPVRLRRPTNPSLRAGDDVFLTLDADHVLVFDPD